MRPCGDPSQCVTVAAGGGVWASQRPGSARPAPASVLAWRKSRRVSWVMKISLPEGTIPAQIDFLYYNRRYPGRGQLRLGCACPATAKIGGSLILAIASTIIDRKSVV